MTYDSGATFNRINSMVNVLDNYEIHIIGKIKIPNNFTKKNVKLHPIPTKLIIQSDFFFIRYINEFYYSYLCSKKSKEINSEIEIITVPYIALIITTFFFGSKNKKIIDVRDLVWEYYSKSLLNKILFKILKKLHLFFLSQNDLITLTNFQELNQLKLDKINSKMIVLLNGISSKKFDQLKNISNLKKNKLIDKIVITYIGNVGIAQNLWIFISAIKSFENVFFRIVGNDFERLKNLVREHNIVNVEFCGNVTFDKVKYFYSETDYLYAKLDNKYKTAIPSKLYEYLSTGKPIIYSGKGAAIELLENFENVSIIDDNKYSITNFLNTIQKEITNSKRNIEIIEKNFIRESNYKILNKLI